MTLRRSGDSIPQHIFVPSDIEKWMVVGMVVLIAVTLLRSMIVAAVFEVLTVTGIFIIFIRRFGPEGNGRRKEDSVYVDSSRTDIAIYTL